MKIAKLSVDQKMINLPTKEEAKQIVKLESPKIIEALDKEAEELEAEQKILEAAHASLKTAIHQNQ